MIIYRNNNTDPYFNMAAEEYLLSTAQDEDVFMLWRNDPAVIIGRNQNAYAEIDRDFAERNGIRVVRRLTGGGAVFHDLGNLNYTFISADVDGGSLNFVRFCTPIIEALKDLGINAEMSGRNDIMADGAKVSGTAQCVLYGHVMHHGTLLWDADLSFMEGVLRPNPAKLSSKGIKSVKSRVRNLSSIYKEASAKAAEGAPKIESVTDLRDFLESRAGKKVQEFSADQIKAIDALANEKYCGWEWNFGRSKEYKTMCERQFPFGFVSLRLTLDGGFIEDISIVGDFFGTAPISELEKRLCGIKYSPNELSDALKNVEKYINGASEKDILNLIIN